QFCRQLQDERRTQLARLLPKEDDNEFLIRVVQQLRSQLCSAVEPLVQHLAYNIACPEAQQLPIAFTRLVPYIRTDQTQAEHLDIRCLRQAQEGNPLLRQFIGPVARYEQVAEERFSH